MNIFEEVKSLNFPIGEYLIAGSGPMAAHGIRDYKDIDILASEKLYEDLKKSKWEICLLDGVGGKREVLKYEKFEVGKNLWVNSYNPNTEEILKSAEIINDVPFLPLSELIKYKKALGREKDLRDIILIEEYLKNKAKVLTGTGI